MTDKSYQWIIVEDDPGLRTMLAAMTTIWGIDTLVFADGHQVSAWLDQIEADAAGATIPRVALLDIRLPGPHGHEIAHRIRSMAATNRMVIVMMTAYRMLPDEMDRILEMARPDLMMTKPLPRPEVLRERIEACYQH